MLVARGVVDGHVEPVGQHGAIGQPGQRVMLRLVDKLFFRRLAPRNILEHPHGSLLDIVRIERLAKARRPKQTAVEPRQFQVHRKGLSGGQGRVDRGARGAHFARHRFARVAGGRRLADHLVHLAAENLRVLHIAPHGMPILDQGNADDNVGEHHFEFGNQERVLLFRLDAFADFQAQFPRARVCDLNWQGDQTQQHGNEQPGAEHRPRQRRRLARDEGRRRPYAHLPAHVMKLQRARMNQARFGHHRIVPAE